MRIRFDKIYLINGFVKVYDKIKNLVLFDYSYYDDVSNKIKYFISGATDSINHNIAIFGVDSYYSLTIAKILPFQHVIILFNSVVSKNKNNYYYNILLEKMSFKDKSDARYF